MNGTVRVQSDDGSYDIRIDHQQLGWEALAEWVHQNLKPSQVIVASDSNVGPLYADRIQAAFSQRSLPVIALRCQAGETAKSIAVVGRWWEELATARVDRHAVLIAVGGGVVGDLAGFVAASHLRGLRFVQVPTSLLAQVDSSVGGKVGINLPQGKNLVGAFWQPQLVWIATQVLCTLDEREFAAGMAEVIKYAMIADAPLMQWLSENAEAIWQQDAQVISQMIQTCCQCKADIVEADTRETTGRRAILNFGHTVGHAIEQLSGYGTYLHGEAVAMGMMVECALAVRMGKCDADVLARLEKLLKQFRLPTAMPEIPFDKLCGAMSGDKKNVGSRIVFVLPTKVGAVEICGDVPLEAEWFR